MSYVPVKLNLTKKNQKNLLDGKSITLLQKQINNGHNVLLHPLNYQKLKDKNLKKFSMSKGEIIATAHANRLLGGNIFDDIWSGIKSAGQWISDNATPLLDVAEAVATPFYPGAATAVREIVRSATGKGLYII